MLIGQAIGAFSSYLLIERNLSTLTEYAYRRDLESLYRFVGDMELGDITTEYLHGWLPRPLNEQEMRWFASGQWHSCVFIHWASRYRSVARIPAIHRLQHSIAAAIA